MGFWYKLSKICIPEREPIKFWLVKSVDQFTFHRSQDRFVLREFWIKICDIGLLPLWNYQIFILFGDFLFEMLWYQSNRVLKFQSNSSLIASVRFLLLCSMILLHIVRISTRNFACTCGCIVFTSKVQGDFVSKSKRATISFGVSSKTDWVISLISILLIPTNRTDVEFKAATHELTKAYFEGIVGP